MKTIKLLAIVAILALTSCEKEELPKDCNCNRVIDFTYFSIPGQTFGTYTTINDCSGKQVSHQYTGQPPMIGDCKK